ncbi:MAG: HAD family hydrolase [Rhodobacteraceae bacterium]|nr:MAG: HAD family hydrolase [Paracoccaceae bacterium]
MATVIFDLDGTLADTAADLVGAANALADAAGWPRLDPVAERTVAGQGGRALIRRTMAGAGLAADEAAVDRLFPAFLAAYEARIAEETQLFPGALDCLDAFAAMGWRIGLCTNKPEGLARTLVSALGVADRFAALLGADTLPVRKPDPRHFTETVRRAGGEPGRALLIGDTVTDRDTARNAGAPCILVTFGYATEPLETLAPDAIAARLTETPGLAAALLDSRRAAS